MEKETGREEDEQLGSAPAKALPAGQSGRAAVRAERGRRAGQAAALFQNKTPQPHPCPPPLGTQGTGELGSYSLKRQSRGKSEGVASPPGGTGRHCWGMAPVAPQVSREQGVRSSGASKVKVRQGRATLSPRQEKEWLHPRAWRTEQQKGHSWAEFWHE